MKYPFYLLLFSLLLFACKENYVDETKVETTKKARHLAVRVANIELTSAPIPIIASGMVGAKSELKLGFKTGGVIKRMYVDETQRVRKGQTLATLRTTEIDAQVRKAKKGVEKATRDLMRIKQMYLDSVATLENVENLTTALDLAKSDLEIATFNQEYSKVISPVSGKVMKKMAENNELVGPGVPVYIIATNSGKGYNLNIGVADKDIIRIKLGDQATVQFDAFPADEFSASVTEIAETADPRTGVFPVELSIRPQKEKALRNGFVGKVALLPSAQSSYFKIPMNALVEGYKEKANIYILNGETAKKISIQPIYIGKDFFTISSDNLDGMEQVITDGAAYLKDGMAVKVVE